MLSRELGKFNQNIERAMRVVVLHSRSKGRARVMKAAGDSKSDRTRSESDMVLSVG